jgi:hypothetical protein
MERGVDLLQQVVDVGPGGCRMGLVEVPVGVGGADDPVPAPGDDEEDRLLGLQDQPGGGPDPIAGHQNMDALARPDVELAALPDHGLGVVGPDSGGVDDLAGVDLELASGLGVARPDHRESLEGSNPSPATTCFRVVRL